MLHLVILIKRVKWRKIMVQFIYIYDMYLYQFSTINRRLFFISSSSLYLLCLFAMGGGGFIPNLPLPTPLGDIATIVALVFVNGYNSCGRGLNWLFFFYGWNLISFNVFFVYFDDFLSLESTIIVEKTLFSSSIPELSYIFQPEIL